MITSVNMGLRIPQIGFDNDPAWETQFIYSFNKIDTHTHDGAGAGVKIPFNNLNFAAATPNLAGAALIGVKYLQLGQTLFANLQPPSAGVGVLQTDTAGNLYYVSPTNTVKLATPTGTSASNGFLGDYNTGGQGGAYYNASAVTGGAVSDTFYFYSSSTPSLDTSSHSNIGARNVLLRTGTGTPSWVVPGTGPTIGFQNGALNDTWYFGMLNATLGESMFGLQVVGGAGGFTGTSNVLTAYETTNSQSFTGTIGKTWGFRLNESATNGLADATAVWGVRSVSSSTSGVAAVYQLAQTISTSGTIQTPANNFGSTYDFRAQQTNVISGAGSAYRQATNNAYWYNAASSLGAWRTYVWASDSTGLTGIELLMNDGTHLTSVFGMPQTSASFSAGVHSTHIGCIGGSGSGLIYLYTDVVPVTTGNSSLGTTGLRFNNLWLSGTATVTGAVTATGVVSSATSATAPFITPSATGNTPGNQYKNNIVLAAGSSDGTGPGNSLVTGSGFNITSITRGGTATYTITFVNLLSTTAYNVAANVTGGNGVCLVSSRGTGSFIITTTDATSAGNPAAVQPFSFIVVGQP